jgi:hypothetical protein
MHLSIVRRAALALFIGLAIDAASAGAQVTVGGVVYAQYGYSLKPDSGLVATTGAAGHDNNFDVTRAYVNVTAKFADGVTTRVTTDVDGRAAAAGQLSIRLKYAFVAWQPQAKGPLTYKLGLVQTPWIDWEENLWDYRMQGTTAFDRNKLFPSSDFGAAIDGMWNYEQVNAQIGLYNGEGYSSALGDPGKDFEARLSVRVAKSDMAGKSGGLRINGYAQMGKSNGGGTRSRLIGNLSYKTKAVTLAAEYALGQDSTAAKTPQQKSGTMSIYGVYNLPHSRAAVIARIDSYDPNTDSTLTASNSAANTTVNKQTRVIGGVSYAVTPNLRVLLDLDLNSLQNGATNSFDRSRQMLYFHTEFKF